MPSAVDICNASQAHFGGKSNIASIDPPDGSYEAGQCARFYPFARREMIDMGPWTWAKRRVELAPVANPSRIWAFAYALPSDCMTPKRVIQQALIANDPRFWTDTWAVTVDQLAMFNEQGSSDYQIEGTTLLTNEPDAVLLYTVDVLDTARFSPSFCAALSYLLASYTVGPILKGRPGAQAAAQYRQTATVMARNAMALDANKSAEYSQYVPEGIQVRA